MLINTLAHLSYFFKEFYLYLIIDSLAIVSFIVISFKLYKSERSEEQKKLFLSLIFSVFIIILTFSAFEAYFRFGYDESDSLGFLQVNKKWQQRHVSYNSDAFRDRNFTTEKKEGVTRIAVIGDSLAFGAGIKDINDRFSNLLEKKLKDSGKNVEVYNLGIPGLDTQAEIETYKKFAYLNFDIIVWEYYLNDIQPEGQSTGTPIIDKNSQRAKFFEFMSKQSYFFDYLYWRFSSTYNSTITQLKTADLAQYKNEQVLSDHKKNIADFLEELKGQNKKVVVVIFPLLSALGPNYPAVDIHKMMGNYFKEQGADIVDLLDYLKDKNGKDLWASRFDTHPNTYVHSLAAEKLYEKILPSLQDQNK